MEGDPDGGSVARLFEERGKHLLRAAVALTGSRADGEDLLQAALERLLRNWRRVKTDPEGYLRRTLYRLAADGWRAGTGGAAGSRRCARRPGQRLAAATSRWWICAMNWCACCSSCRRGSGR